MEDRHLTLKNCLSRLMTWLSFAGIYKTMEYRNGKLAWTYKNIVFIVYAGLINILLFGNLLRCFPTLGIDKSISGILFGRIMYTVSNLSTAIMFPIFNFALSNHLPDIHKEVERYQEKYGLAINLGRLKININRAVTILAIILAFSWISMFLSVIFQLSDPESIIVSRLYPFTYQDGYKYMLMASFDIIAGIYLSSLSIGTFILVIVLMRVIINELKDINKELNSLIQMNNSNLEYLRKKDLNILNVFIKSNKVIQHYFFMVYVIGLPGICLSFYGLVNGQLTTEDLLGLATNLTVQTFGMLVITGIGSTINEEAHAPLGDILSLDMKNIPKEHIQQVFIFISQLSQQTIGVSVYGLLTVQRSTFLMLFGTVITYGIIVLQLKPSENIPLAVTCNCTQ